jgi:ubiquinone/menaquinone biosynthesis C-methylase UbiE
MLKLRKTAPEEPLVLTMTALRMADRLLVIGCAEPKLVAQLATKPGLTGRACAVDEDPQRTALAAAAAVNEGALLEVETAPVTMLPFDPESFDVVVLSHLLPGLSVERRLAALKEAGRVLRGGGRCLVIQSGRRSGLAGLLGGARMPPGDVEAAMEAGGFRAVRTIAERQGMLFVEGARR